MPETFTFEEAQPADTFSFEEARTEPSRSPLLYGLPPTPGVKPIGGGPPDERGSIPESPLTPISESPTVTLAKAKMAFAPLAGKAQVQIPNAPDVSEVPTKDWERALIGVSPLGNALSQTLGEDTATATMREVYNVAKGVPEFALSFPGVVSAFSAGTMPNVTRGIFGATVAKQFVDQLADTIVNFKEMSNPERAKAIVNAAGGIGLLGLLGKGALETGQRIPPEIPRVEVPQVEPKPSPRPEPPPIQAQPDLQAELAKELAVEPEPIPQPPAVPPVERAPVVEKVAATPIEAPSPERPPKNPFRLYLKKGENMNDFLKRATDEELVEAQKNGDLWEKYLKEEQDFRKSAKDATWKDLNPMIYDANHFTTDVNWEWVRRSAEAKPLPVAKEVAPPKAKEPWEMTRTEWENPPYQDEYRTIAKRVAKEIGIVTTHDWQSNLGRLATEKTAIEFFRNHPDLDSRIWNQRKSKFAHKAYVRDAILEGKPVPAEVLADYPDLKIKPPPLAQGKAAETPPPTTPTVSEAGQVSAIPEPAAASAIRQAKPIEEKTQLKPLAVNEPKPTPSQIPRGLLPSGTRRKPSGSTESAKGVKAISEGIRAGTEGPVEQRLLVALQEAETALKNSGLSADVRYADTVANTRGMVRPGGARPTKDAMELRIIELQAAKDFFNKHTQPPLAPPEAKAAGKVEAGPGAATVGDVPKSPQIVQLTEEFKRIEGQKVPFSEKVKEWFNLSEHRSLAQNAFARSLDALKTSRDYLIKKWDGVKDWDDIKRVKGELSAEINTRGWTLKQFEKQTRKSIPRRRDREAISSWLDNGGDPAKLQTALAEAPERYKQSYRDALNLSSDLKLAAEHARSYFEARLQEAMDAGVLEDGITDYIHRIYKRDTPVKQRILNSIQSGVLNTRTPGLAMQRAFQFDYEAEKAGYPIVKDFLPRLVDYEYSLSRVIADRAAVKRFMEIRMGDQRPMIDVAGIGTPIESKFRVIGEDGTPFPERFTDKMEADRYAREHGGTVEPLSEPITEAMLIRPGYKREVVNRREGESDADFAERQRLNFRKDYVERNDYPAFRRWKWIEKDQATGRDTFVQGDVLVHPEAAARIDALMAKSAIRRNPLGAAALGVSSTFKQTMLDFSGFHQVQIAVHGLEHRVTPFNIVKDIDVADPKVQGLLNGGLNIGGDSHAFDYREGLVGRSLSRMIPGLGELMQSYHEYLFRDYIPRIKTTMALHALERNRARMPGLSEEQLNYLTAKQANAAFGGLNYILMERSRTAQDLSRLIMLAPDFLEARGSFALQALQRIGKSGDVTKGIAPWANEQRMALLLGALTMYVTARIVNKMLNDQYHFEPENAFSIVAGGHTYSLRTVQGDLLHLWDKPFQFWLNRLNPVFGRSFLELGTGRDYFGRKRSRMELAWDLLANIRPIAFRNSPERQLWESIANAFGIQAKRWSDTDDAFKLAQKWKEKNGVAEKGEFIYDAEKDPLRPLKIALTHENEAEAAKQINALFSGGYNRGRLTQYFRRYATMPFTGSRVNDLKWRKTLTADELKTVETAIDHRKAILQLYFKALAQYDAAKAKPVQ